MLLGGAARTRTQLEASAWLHAGGAAGGAVQHASARPPAVCSKAGETGDGRDASSNTADH